MKPVDYLKDYSELSILSTVSFCPQLEDRFSCSWDDTYVSEVDKVLAQWMPEHVVG